MKVRKYLMDIESVDRTLLQYETMRSQVLSHRGDSSERGLGLALFIRRGMLAWLEVCHRCTSTDSNQQERTETPVFSYGLKSEMIKVMANITLFNLEEALS